MGGFWRLAREIKSRVEKLEREEEKNFFEKKKKKNPRCVSSTSDTVADGGRLGVDSGRQGEKKEKQAGLGREFISMRK